MTKRPRKAVGRADAPQEVELKFLIDPEALGLLDTLPVIGAPLQRALPAKMVTTYFDTPKRRLTKAGFTLRVRAQDNKYLLTVKQLEKASIERGEWQRSVTSARPHWKDLAASPVAGLLDESATLEPLFASHVERCAITVTGGKSKIELARDLGKLTRQPDELAICELELELKRGKVADLVALARQLVAQAPLRLSFISKAERGLLLAKGKWGKPKRASTPALTSGMQTLPVFLAICRTCLHDFMLNGPALTTADRVEGVHQARIAIRRLRAAFSLFASAIEGHQFEHLIGELKWLSDLFGAARDGDVFVEAVAMPPRGSPLAEAIDRHHAAAHRALAIDLASSRYRLLLLDLAAWLDKGSWKGAKRFTRDGPITKTAGELLGRRLTKLCKRSRDLPELGARKRHRIRIATKKLRYMCEFFQSLVNGKAKARYEKLTNALETMQNSLGALQDEVTLKRFVADLVDAAKPGLSGADAARLKREARQLLRSAKVDRRKHLRNATKAAATLRKLEPFWLSV